MSLTAKDVEEILRLLDQSGFDELELEMEGLKLALRRGAATAGATDWEAAAPRAPAGAPLQAATPVPTRTPAPAPVQAATAEPAPPGTQPVPAPLLGTFYRAPKPGAPPFVEVGSSVAPDTIIGIIEVMKLMNTVRAGLAGTVAAIPARDGTLVEYGEALVHVKPA